VYFDLPIKAKCFVGSDHIAQTEAVCDCGGIRVPACLGDDHMRAAADEAKRLASKRKHRFGKAIK